MLLPNDDWVAFCLMPRFAPNMESFWRNSSSLVAPMAVVEVAWVIWSGRASLSVKTRWTTRTVRRRIMVGEEWHIFIFFWIVLEPMPSMPSISFAWLLPITVAKKWLHIITTTRSAISYVSVRVELWKRLLLKLNAIFFFAARIPQKLLMAFWHFCRFLIRTFSDKIVRLYLSHDLIEISITKCVPYSYLALLKKYVGYPFLLDFFELLSPRFDYEWTSKRLTMAMHHFDFLIFTLKDNNDDTIRFRWNKS